MSCKDKSILIPTGIVGTQPFTFELPTPPTPTEEGYTSLKEAEYVGGKPQQAQDKKIGKITALSKKNIIVDNLYSSEIIGSVGEVDKFRVSSLAGWATDDKGKYMFFLNDIPYQIGDIKKSAKEKNKHNTIVSTLNNGMKDSKDSNNKQFFGIKQLIDLIADGNKFSSDNAKAKKQWRDYVLNIFDINIEGQKVANIGSAADPSFPMMQQGLNFGNSNVNASMENVSYTFTSKQFEDHAFNFNVPFSNKELEKYTLLINPLVAKIEPNYNFFIREYENSQKNIAETTLPNLYVMASELDKPSGRADFVDHITLAKSMKTSEIVRKVSNKQEMLKGMTNIVGPYFENFAITYNSINPRSQAKWRVDELKEKYSDVAVMADNMNILSLYDETKRMFPMYVSFEVDADKTAVFANALKDSYFSSLFVKSLIQTVDENPAPKSVVPSTIGIAGQPGSSVVIPSAPKEKKLGFSFKEFATLSETLEQAEAQIFSTGKYIYKDLIFDRKILRTWDLMEWLKQVDSADDKGKLFDLINPKDGIFLGDDNNDLFSSQEKDYTFFRQLMKVILSGKIRSFIKDKMRDFGQILRGSPAYSETVYYRVEKRMADEDGIAIGGVVQNFYFPNLTKVLSFVDSQVKYGSKYHYEILAYQIVVGSKYKYNKIVFSNDLRANVEVEIQPSLMLVEAPYFNSTVSILDNPPTPPEVEIVPYRAVQDKILLLLNAGVGEMLMDGVIIEAEDKKRFDDIKKARNLEEEDKILFRTDDNSGVFQVFRTDVKPVDYINFTGKKIAEISADINKTTTLTANSVAMVDSLEPNKKYWYTFRTMDNHGLISNPSDVYQVEIINDSGAIYPLVSVLDMSEEQKKIKKQNKKSGKRYIQIVPAYPQTIINESKSGITKDAESVKDVDAVALGLRDIALFGDTYKIRLISKKSGKKIDFNVAFKLSHSKTAENKEKK